MATETRGLCVATSWKHCTYATTFPCNFGNDPIPLPCEVMIGWRKVIGSHPDIYTAVVRRLVAIEQSQTSRIGWRRLLE
jgi:hypothetical protein